MAQSKVKTISANQLTPNTIYFVRGKVSFSRVATQTTDEEREDWNKTRKYKIQKNYTTLSISEARFVGAIPMDPNVQTYANESMFDSTQEDVKNPCFRAINKSPYLPDVYIVDPATGQYTTVKLEKELANGLDVTVAMRVFGTSGNNGVTMAAIYVNEPLRTRENRANDFVNRAAAEVLGLVFSAPAPDANTASANAAPVNNIAAVPANTATPFSAAPAVQQPVVQQPVVQPPVTQPVNQYGAAMNTMQQPAAQPVVQQPVNQYAAAPQMQPQVAPQQAPQPTANPFGAPPTGNPFGPGEADAFSSGRKY